MNDLGPYLRLSDWEIRAIQAEYRATRALPRGEKWRAVREIAAAYGISERSVYRYAKASLHTVRIGLFQATFAVVAGTPTQVTSWERAA